METATLPPDESIQPPPATAALKAISLWQPWASLVAIGAKKIETRSWPTEHRGPIAICATATMKPEGIFACGERAIAEALVGANLTPDSLPFGAVVAIADLVECVEFTEGYDPGDPEKHFGDFTAGRFGFKLENVRELTTPVPCSGAQRIFNLPDDVAAEVQAQLQSPSSVETSATATPEAGNAEQATASPVIDVSLIDPETAAMLEALKKRDEALRSLGKEISAQKRKLEKQESAVANAEAALKEERSTRNALAHGLEELHDELATLANGKASERLPFKAPEQTAAASPPAGTPSPAEGAATVDPDAWRSVRIDSLTPALKPGKLKALASADPPILTLGALTDYQGAEGEWWWKKLKGFGDGGMEQIAAATENYWAKNPPARKEANEQKQERADQTPASVGGSSVQQDHCDGVQADAGESIGSSEGAGSSGVAVTEMAQEAQAPPFDDDAITPGTVQTVASCKGLGIDVAQRVGGKWCFRAYLHYGTLILDLKDKGHFPIMEEATVAAADACYDFIRNEAKAKGKAKAIVDEICRELDALDKRLTAKTGRSIESIRQGMIEGGAIAQASIDAASNEKDSAVRRYRGNAKNNSTAITA